MKRLRKVANIDALVKEVQEIGYTYLLDTIRSQSSDSKIKDAALGYAMDSAKDMFDEDQMDELEEYFFDTPLLQIVLDTPSNDVEELARETTYAEILNTVEGSGKDAELKDKILKNLKGSYTEEEIARLDNISIVSCILGVATAII